MNKIEPKLLPNNGWIEGKLDNREMDYLWKCIENRGKDIKNNLIGHVDGSYVLNDREDWFYKNVIERMMVGYHDVFGTGLLSLATTRMHPLLMNNWWVNFQKEGEYNPPHIHNGVYSFVIWMKIPTRHEEQNKLKDNTKSLPNNPMNSSFNFHYRDVIGDYRYYQYSVNPEDEGTILLFPSKLIHAVYPFYNCKEERISISGNISLDTSKIMEEK